MRNTKAQQEEELKRLREEIGMLGRMNHPNIVRCLGATQHEGHINIFIEWMAGERVGEGERWGGGVRHVRPCVLYTVHLAQWCNKMSTILTDCCVSCSCRWLSGPAAS